MADLHDQDQQSLVANLTPLETRSEARRVRISGPFADQASPLSFASNLRLLVAKNKIEKLGLVFPLYSESGVGTSEARMRSGRHDYHSISEGGFMQMRAQIRKSGKGMAIRPVSILIQIGKDREAVTSVRHAGREECP